MEVSRERKKNLILKKKGEGQLFGEEKSKMGSARQWRPDGRERAESS
jgi:hypothetical protein